MSFKILGTGKYAPDFVIDNNELSKYMDTSDEWIKQRVGVKQRHISIDESTIDLAYNASINALENAKIDASELDLILCSTVSGDYASPAVSCMVQSRLNATCPAMDINAACSGFIFALDTAASFFEAKKVKKVLVVSAERISKLLDWNDRGTSVIFGDGAGAVVLGEGNNYLSSVINTYGGNSVISIPQSDAPSPFWDRSDIKPYIYMNGQETFKFAVNAMVKDIKHVLTKAEVDESKVNIVIPHQANIRIIDYAKRKLNIDDKNFYMNIDRYGNTSSASIPIALDELHRANNIKDNDYLVFSAFGGGLCSGACLIKW